VATFEHPFKVVHGQFVELSNSDEGFTEDREQVTTAADTESTMTMTHNDFLEAIREERRRDKALAAQLVKAIRDGNAEAFESAAGSLFDGSVRGWTIAFRQIVRERPAIIPEIRRAFLAAWIETKSIRLQVGDDRAVIAGLRVLLPPWHGGAKRLFRGARFTERRRRIYGMSWTTSIAAAERFARDRRFLEDSVVLETSAPARAIIAAIKYPKPFTPVEIKRIRRDDPTAHFSEYHDEREYIVDRRHLTDIKVVRRYPAVGLPGSA
jgi:hypothetical protein